MHDDGRSDRLRPVLEARRTGSAMLVGTETVHVRCASRQTGLESLELHERARLAQLRADELTRPARELVAAGRTLVCAQCARSLDTVGSVLLRAISSSTPCAGNPSRRRRSHAGGKRGGDSAVEVRALPVLNRTGRRGDTEPRTLVLPAASASSPAPPRGESGGSSRTPLKVS